MVIKTKNHTYRIFSVNGTSYIQAPETPKGRITKVVQIKIGEPLILFFVRDFEGKERKISTTPVLEIIP